LVARDEDLVILRVGDLKPSHNTLALLLLLRLPTEAGVAFLLRDQGLVKFKLIEFWVLLIKDLCLVLLSPVYLEYLAEINLGDFFLVDCEYWATQVFWSI
jgi:hypothetical protein